jgi:transcriptional regulator with XRE-family HTH domain
VFHACSLVADTLPSPTVVQIRLREWRDRRGFSLRALAEKAGVSYVTIVRIEGGTLSPTVAMLDKLATALDIDVRDFFPPRKRQRSKPQRRR